MSNQSDRGSVTQKHALFLTPTLCVFEIQAKVPRPGHEIIANRQFSLRLSREI